MANLAEQTDVEASLLRALTTAEANYVDALLARASRSVRAYTGQYIEEVDETVTISPDLYGNLRLPQRPVTAIATVIVGGDTLEPADYEWTVDGHIRQPSFNSWEINGAFSPWTGLATVTYTHGYDPIPDDIIGIVADIVAGRMLDAQPLAGVVKAAQVDDVHIDYDTTRTGGTDGSISDDQKRILDKYKQPARPINMVSFRVP